MAHRRRSSSVDVIDHLDDSLHGHYHHDGPFDAAQPAQNMPGRPLRPLDAVYYTNTLSLVAVAPEGGRIPSSGDEKCSVSL